MKVKVVYWQQIFIINVIPCTFLYYLMEQCVPFTSKTGANFLSYLQRSHLIRHFMYSIQSHKREKSFIHTNKKVWNVFFLCFPFVSDVLHIYTVLKNERNVNKNEKKKNHETKIIVDSMPDMKREWIKWWAHSRCFLIEGGSPFSSTYFIDLFRGCFQIEHEIRIKMCWVGSMHCLALAGDENIMETNVLDRGTKCKSRKNTSAIWFF